MGNALKIKMGVDSSGVKKGTKEAQGHLNDFQKKVKTVSLAAAAAWAAVGAAVTKVVKDMIGLTQKWGDRFQAEVKGMRDGYESLIRNIGSGKGWKELIQNMKTAYKEGKKVAEMLDEMFEKNISTNLNVALYEKEIASLRTAMRDQSKTKDEREAAAKRVIELENKIKDIRQETADYDYQAQLKDLYDKTGLTQDEIEFFLLQYNDNQQLMEDAKKLKQLREEAAKAARNEYTGQNNWIGKQSRSEQATNTRNALYEFTKGRTDIAALDAMITIMEKYGNSSDELITNVSDKWLYLIGIEREAIESSRTAEVTIGRLNKVKESSGALTSLEDEKAIQQADAAMSEFADNLLNMKIPSFWDDLLGSLIELHPELEQINEDILKIANEGMAEVNERMGPLYDKIQAQKEMMASVGESLYNSLVTSMSDSISYLAEAMGSGEFNFANFAKAILSPIADACIAAGLMIMTTGEAVEAFKAAFSSLQGYAAIAAGAALIAVGATAKAGLAALASSSSYSSSRTLTSGSSSSSLSNDYATSSMTVNVTGTLVASGSELIAVINNENNRKNHTT